MNRHGVNINYYMRQLSIVVNNLNDYTPSELHRALTVIANSVRPVDDCKNCGEASLVVFDDDLNECLKCQNIQSLKSK